MGSFNTQCFASKQTIAEGDLCRIVVVAQQASYSPRVISRGAETRELYGVSHSTCYADSFWRPVTNFIKARYVDYGDFELLFDPLMRSHVLSFIADMHHEGWNTAAGENTSHDLACDLDAFMAEHAPQLRALIVDKTQATGKNGELDGELAACWKYLMDIAFEHRLFRSNNHQGPRPLEFAVMHEHAYQVLVGQAAKSTDWDGNSNEPLAYLQRALAKARADVGAEIADEGSADASMQRMIFGGILRDAFGRAAGQSSSLPAPASGLLSQLVASLVKGERTEESFIERCLPLLQDQFAIGSLNELNLRFSPQVYAPQDPDNSIGRAYLAFATQVSKKVTRDTRVRIYGRFIRYQGIALSAAEVSGLSAVLREYDGMVDDLVSRQVDNTWPIEFSCPLKLESLRRALFEQGWTSLAESLMAVETPAT